MRRGLVFLVIFLFCLFFIFVSMFSKSIDVTNYVITNDKIPASFDDFKIVQLSDFHSSGYKETTDELINKVESINPDIIVMTGDMVNWNLGDVCEFDKLMKSLSSNYPIYYINGNHEQLLEMASLSKFNDFLIKLKNFGVNYIRNDFVEIVRNDDVINLYSLDIPLASDTCLYVKKDELDSDYIYDKLGDLKEDKFNILLAHNPLFMESYSLWGADLVLAGHMHGGLVRIPLIGVGLLSPEKSYFPKYDAGKFKEGDTTMIINRGISAGSLNVRLFNNPEISVITLKSN